MNTHGHNLFFSRNCQGVTSTARWRLSDGLLSGSHLSMQKLQTAARMGYFCVGVDSSADNKVLKIKSSDS